MIDNLALGRQWASPVNGQMGLRPSMGEASIGLRLSMGFGQRLKINNSKPLNPKTPESHNP